VNSLAPALKLLCKEGMSKDSPLKIKKALKEIDRDNKRFGWTDDTLETLPDEWQWRISTARIQLGYLDYRGWQWRNGRALDPYKIPIWKLGLPIYPVQKECTKPEKVGRLLVYSEQGLGDQIMFAQALKYVGEYADHVTVEVEPRLAPCFERMFPQYEIYGLKDLRDDTWIKEPFDAKITMGDCVARFLRDKKSFSPGAYLTPDPELVEKWKDLKGMTGFTFAGRQAYIDPYEFPEDGVNLQYGEWEPRDTWFTPDIDLKEDFEDVIAITANLEKLISAANTNVHIAGALGVPCDVILSPGEGKVNNAINYRFGMGSKMYWHGSVDIYRKFDQWKHK
jgi:hypothetical protein